MGRIIQTELKFGEAGILDDDGGAEFGVGRAAQRFLFCCCRCCGYAGGCFGVCFVRERYVGEVERIGMDGSFFFDLSCGIVENGGYEIRRRKRLSPSNDIQNIQI